MTAVPGVILCCNCKKFYLRGIIMWKSRRVVVWALLIAGVVVAAASVMSKDSVVTPAWAENCGPQKKSCK
jgi:hypothetical protein